MKVARILAADVRSVLPTVIQALNGYEVLEASSLRQAEHIVAEDGIDLFLIGIHFDDSHAMDLIKFIRTEGVHQNTPIIVYRLQSSDHAEVLRQTLDVMRTIQGISEYLELEGDLHAQEKIRAAAAMCLPAEKRLSTSEK